MLSVCSAIIALLRFSGFQNSLLVIKNFHRLHTFVREKKRLACVTEQQNVCVNSKTASHTF